MPALKFISRTKVVRLVFLNLQGKNFPANQAFDKADSYRLNGFQVSVTKIQHQIFPFGFLKKAEKFRFSAFSSQKKVYLLLPNHELQFMQNIGILHFQPVAMKIVIKFIDRFFGLKNPDSLF